MKYNKIVVVEYYQEHGIAIVPEYRFLPDRQFRFDFAIPSLKIAVEVEGGVWTGGRHTRGKGFIRDMEKYNLAALRGWMVLRTVPADITMSNTLEMVKEAIRFRTGSDGRDS